MVKSSLVCAKPGDADVELRISLSSTSSTVAGLGVMSESDDVLSLLGGDTSPKSAKSCPNKRFRISQSPSVVPMFSCENGKTSRSDICTFHHSYNAVEPTSRPSINLQVYFAGHIPLAKAQVTALQIN